MTRINVSLVRSWKEQTPRMLSAQCFNPVTVALGEIRQRRTGLTSHAASDDARLVAAAMWCARTESSFQDWKHATARIFSWRDVHRIFFRETFAGIENAPATDEKNSCPFLNYV